MEGRDMKYYSRYVGAICDTLNEIRVTDRHEGELPVEEGLEIWCDLTLKVQENDNTVYLIGNGASASMASHMAADFSKNCECRSMAFNDIALMTAVSNDISYEQCFSTPLLRFAGEGDLLVTISSSGNSSNIINAIKTARELGLGVVTLSGLSSGNISRKLGDLNFYLPAQTYGLVESCHQALLHCWLDTFLEIRAAERVTLSVLPKSASLQ
jgi:D-sedoheptulose 7-phosphate isomerase